MKSKGPRIEPCGTPVVIGSMLECLLALCAGNSTVPVNFPHKGQWRGALMFSLFCTPIHDWVYNREAGDLRRYRGHYDVIVMYGNVEVTYFVVAWSRSTNNDIMSIGSEMEFTSFHETNWTSYSTSNEVLVPFDVTNKHEHSQFQ